MQPHKASKVSPSDEKFNAALRAAARASDYLSGGASKVDACIVKKPGDCGSTDTARARQPIHGHLNLDIVECSGYVAELKVPPYSTTPPILPKYVRLPKAGEVEYFSGLGRSALNSLILPTKGNPHPPVRSVSVRKPHQSRGIRLIELASLLDYLRGLGGDQS